MTNKIFCCPECFFDDFLKEHIKVNKIGKGKCSFCGSTRQALISPRKLIDLFNPLIEIYEISEKGVKLNVLLHNDWQIFSDKIDEKNQKIILKAILGKSIRLDKKYKAKYEPDKKSIDQWEKFRDELKHENRFFPELPLSEEQLAPIGKYLGVIRKTNEIPLYRARINKNKENHTPDTMSKPPSDIATNGRANPIGISYLYLASEPETAISEVRPSKGEYLTVAEFFISDDLELLDLRNPRSTISPFGLEDTELQLIYKIMMLLSLLGEELSKPIIPREADLEYLPSQYLCEMIKKNGFDGIIYKSSVSDGDNYVIFNDDKVIIKPEPLRVHKVKSVITESVEVNDQN